MIISIFALIVALLVGLLFSYFALQNTQTVTLQFQNLVINNVPVYVLAIASMLFGLVLSFAIGLADSIFQVMTMFGKDQKIKSGEKSLKEMERKMHDLEMENVRLRGVKHEPRFNFMKQGTFEKPNMFQRLRHRFSI